jgi:plasmid stabilization system protein ParE
VTEIIFSKKATRNLVKQAKYIYSQTKSIEITDRYLDKMKTYIIEILSNFPKSGRPSDDLCKDTRKLVYQGFSIIYRLNSDKAEILTIYRENLP